MMMQYNRFFLLLLVATTTCWTNALQLASNQQGASSRRAWLLEGPLAAAATVVAAPSIAAAASAPPNLNFITTPSGLQYADAKVGTGDPITRPGSTVTIDYVMSTAGARVRSELYSTADKNAPYRWKLGDGSTIQGLEQAIAGNSAEGIEPMRPGGVRRVIMPPALAFGASNNYCETGALGPIPPASVGTGEYYRRFSKLYCNANRAYQPDLVMDIKLYGKR
jgi:FKBP-type peptidyl-prolyl cis-trans isomerase